MKKVMLLAAVLLLNMLWSSTASALLCNVSSTNLAFGSFNPLTGSTVDSTATITVGCLLQLANITITISPGGSGTYNPRRMASGGNTLDYNLYADAGYSQIWGDGTGGSVTVADTIPLLLPSKYYTVYGRIPLTTQRGAMVGSYNDSITVTIIY